MGIILEKAVPEDAYALWIWANDPATRASSFEREIIPWEDHARWLASRLADPDHVVLVGKSPDHRPIGCVRFDTADGWETARLSYVVAPESRGQGLSRPLVLGAIEWLADHSDGVEVWADVMADNAKSLQVFRRVGWREESADETTMRFWSPPLEKSQ